MNMLEKVIKGLESFKADLKPFAGCAADWKKVDDALALLKAQEPRVVALKEIHRGMSAWLEYIDKESVVLAIGGSSAGKTKCFITENDMSVALWDAEYGIRWRAWTREPTNEQRKAVKWDG